MPGTRRLLVGSALLTALAFGPVAAVQASTVTQGAAGFGTTAVAQAGSETTTVTTALPPKPKKKKQYNKGYNAGFTDGRADCKAKKPHDLNLQGSSAWWNGFRDGYNSGFHSCK
ncbi:hypothetical protein [Nonomuraea dietziae]|uniref:hypothetical protein n=1 Tax=Nonomuraea dietziae TaxID=65515 RepID=UPI0033ED96D9